MKKVGKNGKLYLLGMLIGGIGFGLTTVVADTIINSTSVAYKTTTVKAALDNLYNAADVIWQKIYPVGAIYISSDNTNPSTLFGGTWEVFGKGKTLVSVDANDTEFNVGGKTGGSKTKTITVENLPAHTHSVNALNTSNIGNHTHSTYANLVNAVGGGTKTTVPFGDDYGFAYGTSYNTGGAGAHSHSVPAHNTNSTGSGTALNVQNPYITVYMWKRTA